ncbi:MAG: hypothetical protein ACI8YQ_000856 [Polaribacter sp.]|jgi:hypothetical protein
MKAKTLLFTLCFCLLLSSGCKKEELIPKVTEDLEFICESGTSTSFFNGFMGDKHFCYYEDVADYDKEISITSGFRTDGPTTSNDVDSMDVSNFRVWGNLGFRPKPVFTTSAVGFFPHLKHYIFIETPTSSENKPLSELIEQHLTKTGNLPIRSDVIDNLEGFNIVFHFNDREEGVSMIFETAYGNQEDSYLRIRELEINEFPGTETKQYTVTFEFSCKLYYSRNTNSFYDEIRNAEMVLDFYI